MLQVKKQEYFALVMTVATEVELKKTCSSQRDFYLRYNAKVCKPDGIQHLTHYTMVIWDVMTCSLVDCTLIMEAVGSSKTLLFVYQTTHVTYQKNVVLTPAVFPSTNFPDKF
jgi:hypothetical protein